MSHYFVVTGTKEGLTVYKTRMRTRPNSWSTDLINAKKYLSRKTAEGAIDSKGVTLYSIGIKNITVEEIVSVNS